MRRETGITSQPTLQVVRALSVPTQVDGSGLDVYVHQVVDDLTLDVVLDAVDEVAATNVYHLNEGQLPEERERTGRDEPLFHFRFCVGDGRCLDLTSAEDLPVMLIRVQRLVAGFVTFNSPLEIQHSISLVAVPVVWTGHLHFLHREEDCQTANNTPEAREFLNISSLVTQHQDATLCKNHNRDSP